jgi:hypothetical protein
MLKKYKILLAPFLVTVLVTSGAGSAFAAVGTNQSSYPPAVS